MCIPQTHPDDGRAIPTGCIESLRYGRVTATNLVISLNS